MKPPRSPRPAPRTLAAPPPSPSRAPQAAPRAAVFPALATALAGGIVLPACEAPQCGDARADELERHGRSSADALRAGRGGDALQEMGVALGVVAHRSTRWEQPAGAVRPVTTVPQPTPPPQLPPRVDTPETPPMRTGGRPMRVLPDAPPRPPVTTPTTPHPPRLTPPPPGAPPHTTPIPRPHPRGGAMRVDPARDGRDPVF